jgi:hypothetical protein
MGMKILRIYIENSVVGGYFDDEFKEHTQKLFDEFRHGRYKPVISCYSGIGKWGSLKSKKKLKTIDYEEYTVNEEMTKLAEKYMEQKIVSEKYYSDALHIAVATVIGVDVLVSLNFKHLDKIKLFNSVNLREGYNILEIRTPREIVENE